MTQVTLCLVAPAYVIEQRTGFCPVRLVGLNTAQAEWLGQKESSAPFLQSLPTKAVIRGRR